MEGNGTRPGGRPGAESAKGDLLASARKALEGGSCLDWLDADRKIDSYRSKDQSFDAHMVRSDAQTDYMGDASRLAMRIAYEAERGEEGDYDVAAVDRVIDTSMLIRRVLFGAEESGGGDDSLLLALKPVLKAYAEDELGRTCPRRELVMGAAFVIAGAAAPLGAYLSGLFTGGGCVLMVLWFDWLLRGAAVHGAAPALRATFAPWGSSRRFRQAAREAAPSLRASRLEIVDGGGAPGTD